MPGILQARLKLIPSARYAHSFIAFCSLYTVGLPGARADLAAGFFAAGLRGFVVGVFSVIGTALRESMTGTLCDSLSGAMGAGEMASVKLQQRNPWLCSG